MTEQEKNLIIAELEYKLYDYINIKDRNIVHKILKSFLTKLIDQKNNRSV